MSELSLVDQNGEPRVRDIDLAERLEYEQPRDIRKLILRHFDALSEFGVCATMAQTSGPEGGRPATEYLLNEEQAIYIVTQSDAPGARDCKILVVKVFAAWRRGTLLPASYEDAALHQAEFRMVVPLLEGMNDKIDKIGCDVVDINDRLGRVEGRVDDIVPRREFSADTKRRFREVIKRRHGGRCPCCRVTPIVDETGMGIIGRINYDHMEGRERNRLQDGWAVCWECNQKLKDNEFKRARRPHFVTFQFDLTQLQLPVLQLKKGPRPRKKFDPNAAVGRLF